jgi:hypothetical protein
MKLHARASDVSVVKHRYSVLLRVLLSLVKLQLS